MLRILIQRKGEKFGSRKYSNLSKKEVLNLYKYALILRKIHHMGQRSIAKRIYDRFSVKISENTINAEPKDIFGEPYEEDVKIKVDEYAGFYRHKDLSC